VAIVKILGRKGYCNLCWNLTGLNLLIIISPLSKRDKPGQIWEATLGKVVLWSS
jgi:hypothetical protein